MGIKDEVVLLSSIVDFELFLIKYTNIFTNEFTICLYKKTERFYVFCKKRY